MSIRRTLMAMVLIPATTWGQTSWTWILPSSQDNCILSSASVGDRVVFLAEGSTVFWTSDNGASWIFDPPLNGRYDNMTYSDDVHHRLAYPTPDRGYLTQWNGLFVKTAGSSTWTQQQVNDSYGAGSIAFASSTHGWVGYPQARTTNGGISWTPMNAVEETEGYVNGFFALDVDRIWLYTTQGIIKHSTDGGATWVRDTLRITPSTGASFGVLDLLFDTTGVGIATGSYWSGGCILRTTDFGVSWTRTETESQYRSILHPSDSIWVLVGNDNWGSSGTYYQPSFIKSTDAGASWSVSAYPTAGLAPKTAVWHKPTGTMFAGGSRGVVYRSVDLGDTWTAVAQQDPTWIHDIGFFTRQDGQSLGMAVGSRGRYYRSSDDGNHWSRHEVPGLAGTYLNSVADNGRSLWVSGGRSLLRSDDDGFTWTKVRTKVDSLDPSLVVSSIDFLEGAFGIAVASDHSWAPRMSYALLTRDSGATWVCSTLPDSLHATVASIPDENVAFVGGTNWRHGSFGTGFTARTTDRGESWTVTEMDAPVSAMHFSTALIGACGTFGGLYRTTNGGATWEKHTNIVQHITVEDIWFGGSYEGYATIGMEVYETTNGGATWYPYLGIPSKSGAQGVAMSRSRDFFVSTQNGGFLSSKGSAVISSAQGQEPAVPRMAFLQQNFPNPFNGQTHIPFTLDRTRYVRIAVFDMLGREVAVLADGEFGGGSHRVAWDSGNRAAGVYWVALTAGSHRDVRKMLLLR